MQFGNQLIQLSFRLFLVTTLPVCRALKSLRLRRAAVAIECALVTIGRYRLTVGMFHAVNRTPAKQSVEEVGSRGLLWREAKSKRFLPGLRMPPASQLSAKATSSGFQSSIFQ